MRRRGSRGRLAPVFVLAASALSLLIAATVAGAGAAPSADAACHLRWVHAVPDLPRLRFEVAPADATAPAADAWASDAGAAVLAPRTLALTYAQVGDYVEVPPGRYEVRVLADNAGGEALLRRQVLGCDAQGYYTVVALGLDSRDRDRRPDPFERLRRLFGGIETRLDGGELLQLQVLRDHLGDDEAESYVRILHAAPGVVALDAARVVEGDGEAGGATTPVASDLAYADAGDVRRVAPGRGRLEIRFHGARRSALSRPVDWRPGRLYTVVVVGTPAVDHRPLRLVTLSNPLRPALVEPLWTP